jgi:hypothetical protein
MKWGVRNKKNERYSVNQRIRDENVYGKSGVRRINRTMNEGAGIQAARSREATRLNQTRRTAVTAGSVGSVGGKVGGALVGYKIASAVLNKYGTGDIMTDTIVKSAIVYGGAKAGDVIGRHGGQDVAMIAGGYKPGKFRY